MTSTMTPGIEVGQGLTLDGHLLSVACDSRVLLTRRLTRRRCRRAVRASPATRARAAACLAHTDTRGEEMAKMSSVRAPEEMDAEKEQPVIARRGARQEALAKGVGRHGVVPRWTAIACFGRK